MKIKYEAAFQYVKSKEIAAHYPAFALDSYTDEAFLSTLRFMEKFQPDTAILICQRSQVPALQYASENFKRVLGYDRETMIKMSFQDYLDLIHPEDIAGVMQCFAFINGYEPYDPLHYRFELYYRIKKQDGDYISFCEEKMSIRNTAGKYIYLNAYRDVSSTERFHDVKLNVYRCIQSDFKKIYSYNPRRASSTFTPRQKDVANLISRGLTNQQIADQLNVSVNTVKNHKHVLFKKANVRTSVELASIVNTLHRR